MKSQLVKIKLRLEKKISRHLLLKMKTCLDYILLTNFGVLDDGRSEQIIRMLTNYGAWFRAGCLGFKYFYI